MIIFLTTELQSTSEYWQSHMRVCFAQALQSQG